MIESLQFYVGGKWVDPVRPATLDVYNPATEEAFGRISAGSAADVAAAVAAARAAQPAWAATSREERLAVLARIAGEYQKRLGDLATAITEEMGAPASLSQRAQAPVGLGHIMTAIEVLKTFEFEQDKGPTRISRVPIGVCGLITPWNWPMNQIACKVAPALATGCTMVLKPSEEAPFSAKIFAEIMDAAGVPAGVFNMVHGTGPEVGAAISSNPDIDMVSFTGSTNAGIKVARAAAATVKRVTQELGGKSPNIILDDEGFAGGVTRGTMSVMNNSGQSCNAPTRMLVPHSRRDEAVAIATATVDGLIVGDPKGNAHLGPVVNRNQFERVQSYIEIGIEEGASLVAGGPGRPEGLERGFYVKPTVFADVTNDMRIAREEIFGPVLSILSYSDLDEAVEIANDTTFGLSAYVQSADIEKAREIASKLQAGQVSINGGSDLKAPFGGFKTSGNGREWGEYGFHEFVETRAILDYSPASA